mmetsp:Transcript_6576/g.19039  ORF Transcript_6576/g.19039 Transcript_6576/m.19039 type:complete len:95 (-) Transcript_6576:944-1228(-)
MARGKLCSVKVVNFRPSLSLSLSLSLFLSVSLASPDPKKRPHSTAQHSKHAESDWLAALHALDRQGHLRYCSIHRTPYRHRKPSRKPATRWPPR